MSEFSGNNFRTDLSPMSFDFGEDIIISESMLIKLEKRKDNFLITNKGESLITWCENKSSWCEFRIKKLKKFFKKNLKEKELSYKGLGIINLLISQNENCYIDLKKNSYYVFENDFWNSVDLMGDLEIKFEKNVNLKSFKKDKSLLIEKTKIWNIIDVGLDVGYIYAPYVPARNYSMSIGSDSDFISSSRISTRYATSTSSNRACYTLADGDNN
jgi:hypothetical protein